MATLAVDGRSDTQSCTADHVSGVYPWWTVDLGAAYDVDHVIIAGGKTKIADGSKRQKKPPGDITCQHIDSFAMCC